MIEVERKKFAEADWRGSGGPWDSEPDLVSWISGEGYWCLARRDPMSGVWLGYIAVPKGHPWDGAEDEYDPRLRDICIHGGVTYMSRRMPAAEGNAWPVDLEGTVLGFDCSHAADMVPAWHEGMRKIFGGATYRNIEFVEGQLKELSRQAGEAAVAARRARLLELLDRRTFDLLGGVLAGVSGK